MTVVSAMKFNEQEGAIISDEQSSTTLRKFDIAEKVRTLKVNDNILVYGGSGAADFLYDISSQFALTNASQFSSVDPKSQDLLRVLEKIIIQKKERYSDSYLQSNFFVSLSDLQRGFKIANGERVDLVDKDRIFGALNSNLQELLSGGYLVLAKDRAGIEIYKTGTNLATPIPVARPYECIGSGSDMADGELYSFFEKISRDNGRKVDPLDGIAALLNATDAASRKNVGVGGTPIIAVLLKGDAVQRPLEANSRLASEVARATKEGYLTREFMHEALEQLVYGITDVHDEINEKMFSKASDPKKLGMFLRGYKN